MRRIVRLLVGLLAVSGCRDATTGPGAPDPDFAGTYALQTIAGFALPYSVLGGPGFNLEVTGDTVMLSAAGAYVGRTNYRRTNAGTVDFPADTTRGTWGAVGRTITVEAKGTRFFAQASSVELLVDPNGIPFSYRKQ